MFASLAGHSIVSLVLTALAAIFAAVAIVPGRDAQTAWRRASRAFAAVVLISLTATVAVAVSGTPTVRVSAMAVSLVSFVGWAIARFSSNYLAGEPNQLRYVRALAATLAAVVTVLVTSDLLVLAVAWAVTGFALHRLLTFYPERRPAQIAAHKKFLASRVADLCLIAAVVLLATTFGTLDIARLSALVGEARGELPGAAHAAALLIVVAALLKSAQLPFHGWLIQVMEAPTPVSALLHAGVVNLGGFVLIRLAALVDHVPAAQWTLVVVGAATAGLAALVGATRISIKVHLAWSTCAQMGFMLMQCGLGAYELALLHLIAHSLYKAYAFLSSGDVVVDARDRALVPASAAAGLGRAALAVVPAVLLVGVAAAAGQSPATASAWAPLLILAFAVAHAFALSSRGNALRSAGLAVGVVVGWLVLHRAFAAWLGMPGATPPSAAAAAVCTWFAAVYALQAIVHARPNSAFVQSLYPWFYNGLYLDELFTRATFRVWPLPVKSSESQRTLIGANA